MVKIAERHILAFFLLYGAFMNIYLYQSDQGKNGFSSDELLHLSLKAYNMEKGLGLSKKEIEAMKICRTEKGRPYFVEIPVEFSISHSANAWACAMGECRVGLDIQKSKEAKTIEIAKRFFTEEEADFIADHDSKMFFKIWTRKEAVVKFTGEGISYGFEKFSVVEAGKFMDDLQSPCECHVENLDLIEHFECCVCTKKKETIWIKNL